MKSFDALRKDERFMRKLKNLMEYFAKKNSICSDPACTNRACVEERNSKLRNGENNDDNN